MCYFMGRNGEKYSSNESTIKVINEDVFASKSLTKIHQVFPTAATLYIKYN